MSEHAINFHQFIVGLTAFTPADIVERPYVVIGAIAWFVIFCVATWAVFSPGIRDTVLERLSLSIVAICSLSRCFFIFGRGEVPLDGVLAPLSLAFYAVVIVIKTKSNMKRRQEEGTERRRCGRKT